MTKSTKIMIAVIGGVFALCVAITAVVSMTVRNDSSTSGSTVPTTNNNSATVQATSNEGNTVAPNQSIEQLILGKWTDSANMSGYEFFENGAANVTYVNLTVPIINFPINGTASGSYTLNGQELTVTFSIYSKTIKKTFTASVDNNTLTLRNTEDGEVSTYTRQGGSVQDTSTASANENEQPQEVQTGIYGAWASASGDICFNIDENGIVEMSFVNAHMPSVSSSAINGTYNGAFILDETYKNITIQFNYQSKTVTLRFAYVQLNNSLSLNDNSGNTIILVRKTTTSALGAESLLGKWLDSSEMSGYEFKKNGIVEITYVNFTIPVINMPINGTYTGTYSVDGNKVTITSSIYSKTVKNEYTFSISGNTLSLLNIQDGTLTTYTKK